MITPAVEPAVETVAQRNGPPVAGLFPERLSTGLPLWLALGIALRSLAQNSTRSLLATLGIIIGVGCVIAVLALGEGARRAVLEEIRRSGSNLLSVRPPEQRQGGIDLGVDQESLTLEDAYAIARRCPAVLRTSPRVSGEAQVKYRNRNNRVRIMGVTGDYLIIRNAPLARGRLFYASEIRDSDRVCVLGHLVARELFRSRDPLGQRLFVQGQPFTVIGVTVERGEDWDERVWVPVTTAMRRLFSQDHIERIEVQARDEASLNAAARQIEVLLRSRHHLRREQKNDFETRNQQDRLDAASETNQIFTSLLAGIAGVSLLVGGIGIMNVMLVSVTERTREIGIRRAFGARRRDILSQFLIESLLLCGIGAALGMAVGIAACQVGAAYASWPVAVTADAIALSGTVAAGVGLFFGSFPALRAASISPIEALRYE